MVRQKSCRRSSAGCGPGIRRALPATDYVPLFALLVRDHLTEEDITAFAAELAARSDEDTAKAINEALAGCSDCETSEAEIARVRGRLAAAAGPSRGPTSRSPGRLPRPVLRRRESRGPLYLMSTDSEQVPVRLTRRVPRGPDRDRDPGRGRSGTRRGGPRSPSPAHSSCSSSRG